MKNKLVLWKCYSSGHEWKGKSPYERETRPYCSRCGSHNIKVKDWLVDKEKWESARKIAIERAGRRCEACGKELISPRIHHLSYSDYYDPENLVCLCTGCHATLHGKTYPYGLAKFLLVIGILLLIIVSFTLIFRIGEGWKLYRAFSFSPVPVLAGICVGSITIARFLRRKMRRIRRAIRRVVRRRARARRFEQYAILENEVNDTDYALYCKNCGRGISEEDYIAHDGLCKYCRGVITQQGFPSPPGFPKF